MQSIISTFLVTKSLSFSEALNVYISSLSYLQILRTSLMMGVGPLYFLVLKYWTNLLGNSEISLRILSLIFASVTIIFIHHILIDVFKKDEKKSYKDLLLFVLNPVFLILTIQASPAILFICLSTVSTYFFLTKRYGRYFLAGSLAVMTDYSFIFIIIVQGIYFVLFKKNRLSKFFALTAPIIIINVVILGMFLLHNTDEVLRNLILGLLYILGSLFASTIVFCIIHRGSRFTQMATLVSAGILSLSFITYLTQTPSIDMKSAVLEIRSVSSRGDMIYIQDPASYFQVIYYYKKPVYIYLTSKKKSLIYWKLIPDSRFIVKIPNYPNKAFFINNKGEFEALARY